MQEVEGDLVGRFAEPKALIQELLARGWLTSFQANHLLEGRDKELVLGSCLLLKPLGEGAMGRVYQARHGKLGQVVALKVIRQERLEHPDAIRRFQREIQAAAQLSHPNVVRAFDADQVGGTHFFVMEYVQGADLARLVKQAGPLSLGRACDCIRQAALGLQHAHEHGLIHRDIKPSNLLVTLDWGVKLLDMGLARVAHPGEASEGSSLLTQEGSVMGTPDYVAPEQALDPHSADIRADIYSLGCTLYFLLTGQVPFPGGTLTEKLLHHQMDEPVSVTVLRPEVPKVLAKVVGRLMAKRPEERWQTPAEVAKVMAAFLKPRLPSS